MTWGRGARRRVCNERASALHTPSPRGGPCGSARRLPSLSLAHPLPRPGRSPRLQAPMAAEPAAEPEPAVEQGDSPITQAAFVCEGGLRQVRERCWGVAAARRRG